MSARPSLLDHTDESGNAWRRYSGNANVSGVSTTASATMDRADGQERVAGGAGTAFRAALLANVNFTSCFEGLLRKYRFLQR